MNDHTNLYFAYGSNLNTPDWNRWCQDNGYDPKSIRPLFSAWLPDTYTKFTYSSRTRCGGVLDITTATGCITPGVVFQVSEEGWKALDTKEGAPRAYSKVVRQCLTPDGKAHDILTYEVQDHLRRPFVRPSDDYLRVLAKGLAEYELPSDHIRLAAENLPAQPLDAVFVYGSLTRCESRHNLLGRLKCALLAETAGTLFDCGAYPAMRLPGSGFDTGLVQGEFIRIADVEVLPKLDVVEGFIGFGKPGSLFRRALIQVGMRDGRVRQAWTYADVSAVADNSCEIPSASWREHRGRTTPFLRELVRAHVGERETDIARAIANRGPFPPENEEEEIQAILPLDYALLEGRISERQLAQASGKWQVNPCQHNLNADQRDHP